MTLIEVEGRTTDNVIRRLRGFPEIQSLHTTNGAWDLVAELGADSLAHFDAVLGRSADIDDMDWLASLMQPDGRLVLALPLAGAAQRLYALVRDAPDWWRGAEEALYAALDLPGADAWQAAAEAAGFSRVRAETRVQTTRQQLSDAAVSRWFPAEPTPESYAARLGLDADQLKEAERMLRTAVAAGPVKWEQRLLFLTALK